MKEILNHLYGHNTLTQSEAKEILINISEEKYNAFQVASFISAYQMRSITVEELKGFQSALIELSKKPKIDGSECIDLCGTGGDGKNTFNISTLTAVVVAAMGKKVCKHGNYGVSSVCGSSNVLEKLGYVFSNESDTLEKQLDSCNICFLHAPLFHPAMKFVAPIRKEMGVKTFFNMLGPLVNPIQPKYQSVGVFSLKLQRLYNHLLEDSDKSYGVIYDLDGYDEFSFTGTAKVVGNYGEKLISPASFDELSVSAISIYGGNTIDEAAQIFQNVLDNKSPNEHVKVVAANAAIALSLYDNNHPIESYYSLAKETIISGKASETFNRLIALSRK